MNWLQNGSWKTTSAGVLTILGGIVRLVFACKAGNVTEEAVMTTLTAMVGGIGLICARDNDRTSEQIQASKIQTPNTKIQTPNTNEDQP